MKSQEEQWLLKEKYNGEKTDAFYADCKALALGTPLGYLIGHVPFLDCTIHLDEHPLIPRVETEFWVEQAIQSIKESQSIQPALGHEKSDQSTLGSDRLSAGGFGWGAEGVSMSGSTDMASQRILDLCAGSGCIGVAVAKHIREVQVDFAELSKRLIPTIKKNIAENVAAPERCRVFHSNLFSNLTISTQAQVGGERLDEKRGMGGETLETYRAYGDKSSGTHNEVNRQTNPSQYDFILSNPPYIDPAIDRATTSVKSHEPHLALYGGEGGIEIIEQLITAAPAHLMTGGQLWIEHEPEQAAAINDIARTHGFAATNHQDQYKVVRYSILVYDPDLKENAARL